MRRGSEVDLEESALRHRANVSKLLEAFWKDSRITVRKRFIFKLLIARMTFEFPIDCQGYFRTSVKPTEDRFRSGIETYCGRGERMSESEGSRGGHSELIWRTFVYTLVWTVVLTGAASPIDHDRQIGRVLKVGGPERCGRTGPRYSI